MKRAVHILISSLALSACARFQSIDPPAQSDWTRTLSEVRHDVGAGNYDTADRILTDFGRTHPGTAGARESEFWKGVYRIDPANPRVSLAQGIAALDEYLAADSTGVYRDQAAAFRRLAVAQIVLSTAKADSSAATVVKDTVVISNKSKDEQIAALKDQLAKSKEELAKVNAELDRIKKRLANPSN
jgi:hypothetical protein